VKLYAQSPRNFFGIRPRALEPVVGNHEHTGAAITCLKQQTCAGRAIDSAADCHQYPRSLNDHLDFREGKLQNPKDKVPNQS
jgi:hypothetical protein